MEKLNKDELFEIASKLDLKSLLSLCFSNSKFNNLICQRREIWKFLLNRDYSFNYKGTKNPKKLYLKLTHILSYYYERKEESMPQKFTQKEIIEILQDINERDIHIDFGLYFVAAEYDATFLMIPLENNERLFMDYEGMLGEFIMDMGINTLEGLLSREVNLEILGIRNALTETIEQGDIERAKLILKYYEIVEMGQL